MTLIELLKARGLATAVIIDDAYDTIPRAEDLALDDDAWANFLDDVGSDVGLLREAFPGYDGMEAGTLRESNEFVAAVWGLQGTLRDDLWNQLFQAYQTAIGADRTFLTELEGHLNALGITCKQLGRSDTAGDDLAEAGIVFVDLYLGAAQRDPDIERAHARLKQVVNQRQTTPPLVVLMSRSGSLQDKRSAFRDKAKLLSALFRVSSKDALRDAKALSRLVERLARHYPDSQKVAAFLRAWEESLQGASDRFMQSIRRLDVVDYAHIRGLLLEFEGQPLGSYLLDVFDRALQYEIEGDDKIASSAKALNEIKLEDYPAPHIEGSPDLQQIVHQTIWQHGKRLGVHATESSVPVSFGDVLIRKDVLDGTPKPDETDRDAFVVLSAACDLARGGDTTRAVLLSGSIGPLTSGDWTYKESDQAFRTPIVHLPGDGTRRFFVRWLPKDVRMPSTKEITALIGQGGSYSIAARMRESNAIELQQQLFTRMGRVGLIAPMPATFTVKVEAFRIDGADQPVKLDVPSLETSEGVCVTGRDIDGNPVRRLVLTYEVVDQLVAAIGEIAEADVHTSARGTLATAKASTSLLAALERGVGMPSSVPNSALQIKVPKSDDQGEVETVGLVVRNRTDSWNPGSNKKYGAFILSVTDKT